ncbi:MAG: outer membrane protein assembly factor BamA [bacterium]
MSKHRLAILSLLAALALQAPGAAWTRAPQRRPVSGEAESKPSEAQTYGTEQADEKMGTLLGVGFSGLNVYPEDAARDIVGLELGQTLTRGELENAINNLRKWGVFVSVEVLVEYEGGGVRLTFEVVEGFLIKDVTIRGNYPLLEGKVRRTLFLIPGQIYDKSKLPEQLDRLDRLYEQEGYFGTTVLAIEDYNEAEREVTIEIKIQKGKTYRLRDTDIHGNTALDPRRIRNIIFTFSHYKPRQLKKDLAKIKQLYKDKGFVRARVRLDGESYDYDTRKIDVDVGVRQGKRVFVAFEGNDHYFDRVLKKNITIYEDGDFDDFELEASKGKLVRFYKERGYEEVKVTASREKLNDEEYLVTFRIIEGPQRRIQSIDFVGNKDIKSSKLKDSIQTKETGIGERGYYLPALFEEDLKTIENNYKKEGWLDAKIKDWDRGFNQVGDRVILTVTIDENARARVADLHLDGLPEEVKQEVWEKLACRPGEPYSPERLDEDAQYILLALSNHGYPYAKIDKDAVNTKDNLWDLRLKADIGKHVTIGRILFVGNSLTQESTIRKNLRFHEGSEFSAKNILQSQLNLRRLGAFDGVTIETLGLSNQNSVVHAVIRLQEKKTKIIDLEAGYNTDTQFSGKIVFNKLNMWGTGKNFNVKLQGGQEVSRLELNYVDPRVRGSSVQLLVGTFAGFNRRPFFEDFETGAFSTLFKDFGPFLSAFGRLDFEYVNFNESKTIIDQLEPRESADDHTRLQTTLGVTYDRRDSYGDPRKGYYLNGSFTLTNQFLQLSGNYLTANANMGVWYTPFKRITFANALRVSKIFPFPGNTFITADERLYLGGDDTVRGFSQDSLLPTGGTFSLVHNFEMQIRAFNNFQVVGFLDTGIVIPDMSQFNLFNLRHSAGPGIRYVTPVGPIRLDYGVILDPHPGDSRTRLHFTFGYFF